MFTNSTDLFEKRLLRIKLADTNQSATSTGVVRPGTILYGEIEYKPPSQERLSALTVSFVGKMRVKVKDPSRESGGKKMVKDVTQLFQMSNALHSRDQLPLKVMPRVNTFPFHFVVPYVSELDRSGTYHPDPEGLFEDKPHRVPPTLEAKYKGDASVEYSVYVVARQAGTGITDNMAGACECRANDNSSGIEVPRGKELDALGCVVELDEIRAREIVRQDGDVVVEQRIALPGASHAPAVKGKGLFKRSNAAGLRQSSVVGMNAITGGDGDGCGSRCVLTIAGAKTLVAGKPFALRYGMTQLEGNNDLRLSIKSIEVVVRTHRRVKQCVETFTETSYTSCARSLHGNGTLAVDPAAPTNHKFATDVLKEYVPSFKSYTVSRAYALRVTVQAQTMNASEDTQVEFPVNLVRVREEIALPRRATQASVSATNASGGNASPAVYGPGHGATALVDLPPVYEESPAYVEVAGRA